MGDYYVWTGRRIASLLRSDLLHLHYGGRTAWARKFPRRPYVVHLHGTDIRTQYRDPRYRDEIQQGLDGARAVVFSTPDLADAALEARPDATYLPNPIDVSDLPQWAPADRPTVVFTSRWEPVKGLDCQLKIARLLREALPNSVDIVGLDWGEGAKAAARAGVRLVPPMPRPAFLAWVASAHLAVGQSAGLLAMSELQALGIGVPTFIAHPLPTYPAPPVLIGDLGDAGDIARHVIADPAARSAALNSPAWIRKHHGVEHAVARLRGIYRAALGGE
ncbi:hypothetical protein [Georgenia sp. 1P01AC]|uniref:hypothetical protein n=1 Tax=Georgenia sp. 1P01AC TaxID=554103 RepID=UPI0039AEB759